MLEWLTLTRPGGARAWFEADGQGGWACLPLDGRPRQADQHLYQVGSLRLSHFEEELTLGAERHPLAGQQLSSFRLAPHPHFTYEFTAGHLQKELLFDATGALLIRYQWQGEAPVSLRLAPHLSGAFDKLQAQAENDSLVISTADDGNRLYLTAPTAKIAVDPWQDKKKYSPGQFEWQLPPGGSAYLEVATQATPGGDRLAAEVARREQVLTGVQGTATTALSDPLARALTLASDKFVTTEGRIVSYPEGDTLAALISLTGLTLSTNRIQAARTSLHHLAEAAIISGDEESGLWLFQAIYQYLAHTRDVDFVRDHLTFPLEEVVGAMLMGSPQGFKVDPATYLLNQGDQPAGLKWQALWYSAIRVQTIVQQHIAKQFEMAGHQGIQFYLGIAKKLEAEITALAEALPDLGHQAGHLFALSLAYPAIEPTSPLGQRLFKTITEQLLQPLGLKTERGVEPWLLGPYLTAHLRVNKDRQRARELLNPLADQLLDAPGFTLGVLPQAFSDDQPPLPIGACAWAPSIAEPLRVLVDEILE